jgi:lysozyme
MINALVSFSFNVGLGSLKTSTLLKKVNNRKFEEASNEFLKWNKAKVKGKLTVLIGLDRRRKEERELFLRGYNA